MAAIFPSNQIMRIIPNLCIYSEGRIHLVHKGLKLIEFRKRKKPFNSLSARVNENSLDPDQAERLSQKVWTKIGHNNHIRPDLDTEDIPFDLGGGGGGLLLNICPLKYTYVGKNHFNFISVWSKIMSLKSDQLELGMYSG